MRDSQDSTPIDEIADMIMAMLRDRLNLVVPSVDTDLIGEEILDSLALVDLINFLDAEFRVSVAHDQLALDNFQTVGHIARMVSRATDGLPCDLVS